MAHRRQCWYYGNMDRFINPRYHNQRPHPALWNAIYLLACHYTQIPYYTDMEAAILTQALDESNAALEISDRLLDIVQASSLIAMYMYNNNRAVEGYRQAFSAARLAIGIGLHQMHPADNGFIGTHQLNTVIPIAAPRDDTELSDRIFVFWQAFAVDRCWSAFHGLPLAFLEKDDPQCRVTTPWPVSPGNPVWVSGLHLDWTYFISWANRGIPWNWNLLKH
jgi:Fungal specific transcription factor domain